MIKQRWKSNRVDVCVGDSRAGGSSQGQGDCEEVWEHWATCECGEGSSQAGLASSAWATLNCLSVLSNKPRQTAWVCKSSVADIVVIWKETSLQSSQRRNPGDKNAKKAKCYFVLYVWTSLMKKSLFPFMQLKRSQFKTDFHPLMRIIV